MESIATEPKRDINILSNILLSDNIFNSGTTKFSDTSNKENVDCQEKASNSAELEEPPMLFKNLAFDLPPVPKRKNSFSDTETPKKRRAESCDEDADNEDKIFNYLTGTYESAKDDSLENNLEISEENLLFDEGPFIKETSESASEVAESHVDEPENLEVSDNRGQLNGNPNSNSLDKSMLRHQLASEASNCNGKSSGKVMKALALDVGQIPRHLEAESILGQLWEYKCKSCSYIAETTGKLMSHIRSVHLECSGLSSSSNVHIDLSEPNNWTKPCTEVPSAVKTSEQTSVLFKLLTGDDCVKESIVLLSDDEMAAVSSVIVEKISPENKSQRGTSEDNIVVLSSDDESGFAANTSEAASGGVASDPATSEMDGSNDAISGGHETILNMAEDETNENYDISQEDNGDVENDCSDVDNDRDADKQTNNNIVGENHKSNLQCFDCRSYSDAGDLPQYRLHVAKHIGSKFLCMSHSDACAKDCAKCYYETTLSDVAKCIKRCLHCGFVTDEASKLKAHREQNDACDVSCRPGDVKCFHCPYVTSRKKYLYYHAVDHIGKSFACSKHVSASSDECSECVYAQCLKMAKRDALDCDICGFKTVIMAVFDVHQCYNNCIAPYICWDCKLDTFNTVGELREHAVVHYKSEFRCADHKRAVSNCSQCLYQALAGNFEGNVFACEKCDYKSLCEESFGRHCAGGCSVLVTSQLGRTDNQLECFLCDYKTSSKNLLKHHCKKHYGETFACHNHTSDSPQVDCPRCTYQELLSCSRQSLFVCDKCSFKTFNGFHFQSHTSQSHPTLPFQCFDCADSFQSFRRLKYHAICHSHSSKFKCPDHNDKSTQAPTCPKCIYENIIRNTKEGTFLCKKCGYKSRLWTDMKRHESDETLCETYKATRVAKPVRTYACFDCNFAHERLDALKAHVKAHRASKFQCDQHDTPKANCPKCRHVQLVAATTRGRLCCYDCAKQTLFVTLSDLRRHVAQKHPRSNFACTLHDKKNNCCGKCLYQEVVEDVVGDRYVRLICCDCGKLFARMAPYEEHIVSAHGGSTFLCPKHCGAKPERCSKCLYQRMLQRHSIIAPTSKTVTFRCFQCDYSTKHLHNLIRHAQSTHKQSNFKCREHGDRGDNNGYCPQCFYHRIKTDNTGSSPFIRCYECNLSLVFYRLGFLKSHIKEEHEKCSFVCALHPRGGATNCAECWFEILAHALTHKRQHRYQCFGCSYATDSFGAFKCHVHQSHRHTKFKCADHADGAALVDCPRCFYAAVVSEDDSKSPYCYACVKPTPFPEVNALTDHIVANHRTSAFICASHIVEIDNCDSCSFQRQLETIREQLYSPLNCFDCGYKTAKFAGLRYHVWQQHRDSEYQCRDHVAKTIDCQMCSYATMIEHVRNFTCYACDVFPVFSGVDALKRHVFNVHDEKDDPFVCPVEHSTYRSRRDCGKCFFQKAVRDAFILQCHDCDVASSFGDKDCLIKHIKERHVNSRFVCNLHALGPKWDTCSQCCYEQLLRAPDEPGPGTSAKNFATFKCFDCTYQSDRDVIIKWHIQDKHCDSEFTCRTHSLGDIDGACSECRYENLILQVKERFVLSFSS